MAELPTVSEIESSLIKPEAPGVLMVADFIGPEVIAQLVKEVEQKVTKKRLWLPAGETYENKRGIEIVQAHDVFSLDLRQDQQASPVLDSNRQSVYQPGEDESSMDYLPEMKTVSALVQSYVRKLAGQDTRLKVSEWTYNEATYHRYFGGQENPKGLSGHRDNSRFTGVIAILGVSGETDLLIGHRDRDDQLNFITDHNYEVRPGVLALIRAPGLYEGMSSKLRPEHAVVNPTARRISLMLRDNSKPYDPELGFKFNNVPDSF